VIIGEEVPDREFGDAPEGPGAVAYPSTGVLGAFPTCITVGPSGWIQHNNFGAWFGPTFDFELDGNGGSCPGCFPLYDQDECFLDGDAGLIIPDPFTIDPGLNVIPCPSGAGTPLGVVGQTAVWGTDIDIDVHNTMPGHEPYLQAYVNVLMDWNQNGVWGDPGEHVLVNFVVPPLYIGLLSALGPPNFVIGPNSGYVWSRFSITEVPVTSPPEWNGEGDFEDGETEDYLLQVIVDNPPVACFTWVDADGLGPGTMINFNAGCSTDDNGITLYEWDWDNNGIYDFSSVAPTATHDYGDTLVHTVTLRVTDTASQTHTFTDTTVQAGIDNPPVACFTWVDADGLGPGTMINFNAGCSTDDNGITLYEWDWDNNGIYDFSSVAPTATHDYGDTLVHTVTLRVTDTATQTHTFTDTTVQASTGSLPPVADFDYTPANPTTMETVYFNSTSTDPDGTIVNWTWNIGGIIKYGEDVTHQFTSEGTYIVTLQVEDDTGHTADTSKLIPVGGIQNVTGLSRWWNLFSLPFNQSIDKTDIIVKYNDFYYSWDQAVNYNILVTFVFGWNSAQYYDFADTLEPGQGYWLFCYEFCEIWIENITVPTDDNITQLGVSWNLIGSPSYQPVDIENLIVNHNGTDYNWTEAVSEGIVNQYVFGWESAQYYNFATTLKSGHGYWMYAYKACTLKR